MVLLIGEVFWMAFLIFKYSIYEIIFSISHFCAGFFRFIENYVTFNTKLTEEKIGRSHFMIVE